MTACAVAKGCALCEERDVRLASASVKERPMSRKVSLVFALVLVYRVGPGKAAVSAGVRR